MATRCNIVIKDSINDSKITLYRHWDGYPAMTGADLVKHLVPALDAKNGGRGFRAFVTSLITAKCGGDGRDADKPQYEVTDQVHGDIEHLYEFSFNAGRANHHTSVAISHSVRRPGDDKWGKVSLDLAQFVGLVNADRVAINQRLAVLRGSDKHYADAADYALITLEAS